MTLTRDVYHTLAVEKVTLHYFSKALRGYTAALRERVRKRMKLSIVEACMNERGYRESISVGMSVAGRWRL